MSKFRTSIIWRDRSSGVVIRGIAPPGEVIRSRIPRPVQSHSPRLTPLHAMCSEPVDPPQPLPPATKPWDYKIPSVPRMSPDRRWSRGRVNVRGVRVWPYNFPCPLFDRIAVEQRSVTLSHP